MAFINFNFAFRHPSVTYGQTDRPSLTTIHQTIPSTVQKLLHVLAFSYKHNHSQASQYSSTILSEIHLWLTVPWAKLCLQCTNKMHTYNKTHALNVTISATCFSTYCIIFRENFFMYVQKYCSICDFISLQLLNSYLKKTCLFQSGSC